MTFEKNSIEEKIYKDSIYKIFLQTRSLLIVDNLETIIEMSQECAEMYYKSFIGDAEKEKNLLFHSLRTIHARALLTSKECLVLLKNGYSDGAFSRWRTLYNRKF